MKRFIQGVAVFSLTAILAFGNSLLALTQSNVMPPRYTPVPGFGKHLPGGEKGSRAFRDAGDGLIRHKCGVPTCYQETDYWCGPAAAQQLLAAKGVHVTQAQLARELGTTENGTDSVYLFPPVLNRYLGWAENPGPGQPGYRAAAINGDRQTFLNRIFEDTRTGDPMIYNIEMAELYGEANRGGHYVTGNGWREKNGQLYDLVYVDPWRPVGDDYYLGEKVAFFNDLCRAIERNHGTYVW